MQNDLKSLMSNIEEKMQIYFKTDKEIRIKNQSKIEVAKDEPIAISVSEDAPTNNSIMIPFAWVDSVAEGSPAEEAGLKVGDGIINFDRTIYYGISQNPLKKIAEIVGGKIDQKIEVNIMRKDNGMEENIEFLNIILIPHQWSGQGVLG